MLCKCFAFTGIVRATTYDIQVQLHKYCSICRSIGIHGPYQQKRAKNRPFVVTLMKVDRWAGLLQTYSMLVIFYNFD